MLLEPAIRGLFFRLAVLGFEEYITHSLVTLVTNVTMLITANDIAELLSATRPWVYKLMQEHDFPKPIRIGTGVRWESAEVQAWIEAQKAKRDSETANV